MTEDQWLDDLAAREGTHFAEPPAVDQPTGPYGITLATLAADRGGSVSMADLKALDVTEARAVARRLMQRFVVSHGFGKITYEPLRMQMLDYAYNSGPERAVRWLQRTLGFAPGYVTGLLDDRTLVGLDRYPAVLVNNALAGSRAHAALHGGVDPKFARGVAARAIEFVVPLA